MIKVTAFVTLLSVLPLAQSTCSLSELFTPPPSNGTESGDDGTQDDANITPSNGDTTQDDADGTDSQNNGGQDDVVGQCPNIRGTGTQPGAGSGSVGAALRFDGQTGSATCSPVLPNIANATFTVSPGSENTLTFSNCPEQIVLRDVSFTDGAGQVTSAGDVTFSRGTDYSCGESLTISFALPCDVELRLP
ncbi:MAG: hypothetical protein AMXMBFR13_08400 [Phycisphaerae bacterium]